MGKKKLKRKIKKLQDNAQTQSVLMDCLLLRTATIELKIDAASKTRDLVGSMITELHDQWYTKPKEPTPEEVLAEAQAASQVDLDKLLGEWDDRRAEEFYREHPVSAPPGPSDIPQHELLGIKEAVDWPEHVKIGKSFFTPRAIADLHEEFYMSTGRWPRWE